MSCDIILNDLRDLRHKFEEGYLRQKRVLISGGAGFIGSWLADAMIGLGANVTCLDNLSTSETTNIGHLLGDPRFRFVQDDVINFSSDEKYDFILHLASRASPEDYQLHPIETLLANSLGTHRMLELARKTDSRILYSSSSEVYGDAQVVPTPEDYRGSVNPIGPRSCYDEGKRFGEAVFVAYRKEYGLDTRIARIFNTYGPRIRANGPYARVVPRFVRQALTGKPITVYGDGSQTRSFCYVADTVAGLLKLLTVTNAEGEVVNLGSAQETTLLELANKIKMLTGSESRVVFGVLSTDDPRRRCPSISKAKRLLDWEPTVALIEGLKRTIGWFREGIDKEITSS